MHICKYCKKLCKPLGLASHERLCPTNPNRKIEDHPSFGKKGKNQYTKAKVLNLEYIPTQKEIEGWKRTANARNQIRWENPNARKNQSDKIKAAIIRNPDGYSTANISGRAKLYEYKNSILKGTWELEFAKWLDSQSISWTNKILGFSYEWNGIRTYFPDFYLPYYDIYIEVKGYVRDRDLEKWKVVNNLKVITYLEIKKILNNTFTLSEFENSGVVQRQNG